jgi:hypothetical protein
MLASALSGVAAGATVFSTRRGYEAPGYGRDEWRRVAHQIGVRRGRYFVVTQAQLEAFERGKRDPKPPNDRLAPATWTPAVAADELGLRPARGVS